MIRIRVVGRHGVSLDGSLAQDFGPAGGTIGRADTNTLVLSDPDRTVSRVHAQVLHRGGEFFVVDRGSNPLQCNGVPLGNGNELALTDGARLLVGTFELSVELLSTPKQPGMEQVAPAATASSTPDDDPFADLLAGLPGVPVAVASTPESARPVDPRPAASAQTPDDDPFADLLSPVAAPAASTPDDFSDLGMPGFSAPVRAAARIDELFGAPASGSGLGLMGDDPLGLSPSSSPLQPNTNASADDPFASFGQQPAATGDPRPDHVPVERFGFVSPVMARERGAAPVIAPAQVPAPAPVPAAPAPPVAPRAAQGSLEADALLAAFLRGVGPLHQMPTELTPALMERIGVLLRSSTEGTLQLLQARQELKREVRAEVTLIGAQANNPLKFSPTADVALAHLLGPAIRGFMPAEPAMHDAFDDLRAHQFGVMVGMRAALAELIERFGPEHLEKKIAAKSALDSLFSAQRKARLWDQFIALYATIAREAEDDFHALFGKAFAEAYEQQMARLKSDEHRR
ncbi:type VI secretion system-associated FHA domain protein TagH [Diaphorobacter aerolatus]|uniref:Type VI secretion system-associated FHA domain protein TagH n=1 Tax=Diaphorobacter aerolatus TaxID=1288495 RepID=A0A7H0GLJ0_9BURK|nr:type VI secretion system-associated FHA domain protein TagH [Diaphorobacter aerolatus]QNP49156.1 type VI secretion system-associated FHA domain protein TagH [Diaphorobacter aerolatus]